MQARHERSRAKGPLILADDHPALIESRPLFPGMVRSADSADRVLKLGQNRKLKTHWRKVWSGMPIYTLSLPERTSCPASCQQLAACYGNRQQITPRYRVDAALIGKLTVEIELLAMSFSAGFSVRLHQLGDFATRAYTEFWLDAVRDVPQLRVFGFTAWSRTSEIGALIEQESARWDRFRIRFSGDAGERGSLVMAVPTPGKQADRSIACPYEVAKGKRADSCGSCGLCLSSRDPVVFKLH